MKNESVNLSKLRENYTFGVLDKKKMHSNPFEVFQQWMEMALSSKIKEANAMTLATSSYDGKPSARIVLLKDFTNDGLVFYTNYRSRKGEELLKNSFAALLFYWDILERQIRIEGKVKQLSPEMSDEYFNARPKGSQIGAIASPQSQVISSRNILEEEVIRLNKLYEKAEQIDRPKHWGGFILKPNLFEFWQGRPNRLHDRFQYTLEGQNNWQMERLAP